MFHAVDVIHNLSLLICDNLRSPFPWVTCLFFLIRCSIAHCIVMGVNSVFSCHASSVTSSAARCSSAGGTGSLVCGGVFLGAGGVTSVTRLVLHPRLVPLLPSPYDVYTLPLKHMQSSLFTIVMKDDTTSSLGWPNYTRLQIINMQFEHMLSRNVLPHIMSCRTNGSNINWGYMVDTGLNTDDRIIIQISEITTICSAWYNQDWTC